MLSDALHARWDSHGLKILAIGEGVTADFDNPFRDSNLLKILAAFESIILDVRHSRREIHMFQRKTTFKRKCAYVIHSRWNGYRFQLLTFGKSTHADADNSSRNHYRLQIAAAERPGRYVRHTFWDCHVSADAADKAFPALRADESVGLTIALIVWTDNVLSDIPASQRIDINICDSRRDRDGIESDTIERAPTNLFDTFRDHKRPDWIIILENTPPHACHRITIQLCRNHDMTGERLGFPSYRLNYMRLTINNRVMPFYSVNSCSPLRRRVKPHAKTIFLIWLSVVPVPQRADSRRQYNSDTIDEFCFPALRHVSYLPFRGRCAARHSVSSRHLRSFYGRSADIGQTTIPSVRR